MLPNLKLISPLTMRVIVAHLLKRNPAEMLPMLAFVFGKDINLLVSDAER